MEASEELQHLNLVLQAIRNVNQLITHEKDRDRLLQGACDQLIATRGYHNVWIALLDRAGKLETSAQAGFKDEFAALSDRLKRGELPRCGENALQKAAVIVTKDPLSTCSDCPLSKSYGGRAGLTVRLEHNGHTYGLMSASVPAHLITQQERGLFKEVASDIAFALHAIELEQEHKRENERIKRGEVLFRTTLASIGDAVITTGVHGHVQYMNAVAEQLSGWNLKDARGRLLTEVFRIVNEDSRQIVDSPVERVLSEGVVVGLANHTLLITKDGGEIPIADSAAPIKDDSGKMTGVVLVFRDQTAEREAQQAVQNSERFLDAILASIQDGISVLDPDLTIRYTNKVMKEWYEAALPLGGKKCYRAYQNRDIPCDPCPTLRCLKSGKTEHDIVPGLKGSSIEWIELFSYPMKDPDSGEITNVVEFVRDITQRVRAEKEALALEMQLVQAQKLESIGTLASGVAHEINNPLTGMINYAELISEKTDNAELRKFALAIMKEGNRVAGIIKDLLYFARQEQESHSPARMEDIIDASLNLVGAVLRKDQITLEKDIPKNLPQVRCRSQQIEQVIINLLTNAKDALNQRYKGYHEDKLIKIEVKKFEKDGIEWIGTTIEDHGVGISEENMRQIFNPFFTTKPRDVGTGLGLSVSYGIVKEHHGELTVESEPGKYTKFHLNLRVNNGWTLQ